MHAFYGFISIAIAMALIALLAIAGNKGKFSWLFNHDWMIDTLTAILSSFVAVSFVQAILGMEEGNVSHWIETGAMVAMFAGLAWLVVKVTARKSTAI